MEELNKINKQLDIASKILGLAFKIGIFLGGLILLFYCYRIEYFPEGATLGDGLVFLFIVTAFGGLYTFFTLCLLSLGILLRPAWEIMQKIIINTGLWVSGIFKKEIIPQQIKFIKGDSSLFIFALFGLLMIVMFRLYEPKVIGTLVLTLFGCAAMAAAYKESSSKIIKLEADRDSLLNKDHSLSIEEKNEKISKLKTFQLATIFIIFLLPLLVGGVSGKLLDGAMRLANVREDQVNVHIKKPYSELLVTSGITPKQSPMGKDYSLFSNVNILINGIGVNTVIAISAKNSYRKWSIPKSSIYVETR